MNLDEYQKRALLTAIYPNIGNNLTYPVVKLCAEAGEVAGKFGQVIRDSNWKVSHAMRYAMAYELGDVLWYIAATAHELGFSLEEIAVLNNDKLLSRQQREILKGEGDYR